MALNEITIEMMNLCYQINILLNQYLEWVILWEMVFVVQVFRLIKLL